MSDFSRYSEQEAEKQRLSKEFPSVSVEFAESLIDAIHYDDLSDEKTIICTLEVFNRSFSVQGHSSASDVRNFDRKLARTYSYKRALDKLITCVAAVRGYAVQRSAEGLAEDRVFLALNEVESDIRKYDTNMLNDADGDILNLLVKYKKILKGEP